MGRSKFRQRNREKKDRNIWVQDRGNNGDRRNDGNNPDERDKPRGYSLAMKTNEAFENYYKNQEIVPEGEWDDFMQHLRDPLPSTFRVAGFRAQACELVEYIKGQYFSSLRDLTIDDKKIDPPRCLPWYPDQLAWQLNLDRGLIRKNDKLKNLHQFLISETESGNISRQEAVSMLPPLVLDIKPHHKILDMCAAPGSKTSQLIEMLHADENVTIPDGFVVANDSDNKRCYLMVHQVKRLESPNFMIINHDATQLPNLRLSDDDRRNFVTYDRVLCDVPCSGDGTMRKNPDVWYKWNAGGANNLHNLQCRILKRGLEVLEVGGRLVYSTCSFNPVEDEAVVGSMLAKCEGSMRLLDVSAEVPGLKFLKGTKTWKVMTRDQQWYEKFSDVPEKLITQIRPSMFPLDPELADKYNLENCIRILPHQQNTGGFFVAVLEKTSHLPWTKDKEPEVKVTAEVTKKATDITTESKDDLTPKGEGTMEGNGTVTEVATSGALAVPEGGDLTEGVDKEKMDTDVQSRDKRKADTDPGQKRDFKKPKLRGYREDPFVWLSDEDPVWPPIKKFFGMKESFSAAQLMVRCAEGKKRYLYYTSKAIRNIVELNNDRVKFINMGVKMFARSDSVHVSCDFRLVNDGINVLYPFIGARVVEILGDDLCMILSEENPYLQKLSNFARQNMSSLDQGGLVFIVKPSGKPHTPKCDIVLTGWLGKSSCRSFLGRYKRSHYLRLFGRELTTTAGLKKDEKVAEENAEAVDSSAGENIASKALCDAAESKVKDDAVVNDENEAAAVEASPILETENSNDKTDDNTGDKTANTAETTPDSTEKMDTSTEGDEKTETKQQKQYNPIMM